MQEQLNSKKVADTLSLKNKETVGNNADEERAGADSVRTAHYQMAHQDSAVILDRKEDVLLVWSKLSEDHLSGIGHFIGDLLSILGSVSGDECGSYRYFH